MILREILDETLIKLPGYLLRRAANNMMADLRARLSDIELRVAEASLLIIVNDRQDMTSTEIGKILDIKRANMVPLLKGLEAKGFIERVPLDLKSNAIILTQAGFVKRKMADQITTDFEQNLLERIPQQHREHFLQALDALS